MGTMGIAGVEATTGRAANSFHQPPSAEGGPKPSYTPPDVILRGGEAPPLINLDLNDKKELTKNLKSARAKVHESGKKYGKEKLAPAQLENPEKLTADQVRNVSKSELEEAATHHDNYAATYQAKLRKIEVNNTLHQKYEDALQDALKEGKTTELPYKPPGKKESTKNIEALIKNHEKKANYFKHLAKIRPTRVEGWKEKYYGTLGGHMGAINMVMMATMIIPLFQMAAAIIPHHHSSDNTAPPQQQQPAPAMGYAAQPPTMGYPAQPPVMGYPAQQYGGGGYGTGY